MSKVGVIFCAWQSEDTLLRSMQPWMEARAARLSGHDFVICAISMPFEGFPLEVWPDDTRSILDHCRSNQVIDHVIATDIPRKETEARGAALKWLAAAGCDLVWQVDSDEFYTTQEIERILAFVEARPGIPTFRGSLKNYVLDSQTYLTEPFNPMRIHRIYAAGGYVADGFYDDNNVRYTRPSERGKMSCPVLHDTQMPSLTIPKAVAWTRHESWPNSPRSLAKIRYQQSRPGWRCSFDWDDARGGLIWRDGQPIPETARDL